MEEPGRGRGGSRALGINRFHIMCTIRKTLNANIGAIGEGLGGRGVAWKQGKHKSWWKFSEMFGEGRCWGKGGYDEMEIAAEGLGGWFTVFVAITYTNGSTRKTSAPNAPMKLPNRKGGVGWLGL